MVCILHVITEILCISRLKDSYICDIIHLNLDKPIIKSDSVCFSEYLTEKICMHLHKDHEEFCITFFMFFVHIHIFG